MGIFKHHIPKEAGEKKMFVVHFFESKNLLLTQFVNRIPDVGEDVKIKGRKAKVASVNNVDKKNVNVHVVLEVIKQSKQIVDNSKKKRR